MKKLPNKIAIIGGGIAGLSAAYYLSQNNPNLHCKLFEKNNHLGGNIQTRHQDGFLYETGPDAFLLKPIMDELLDEIKVKDQLIQTNPKNRISYIVRNGKLVKVPPGFYLMGPAKPLSFLFSPALSISTKLRTMMEPLIPKQEFDDESLASFVTRRFGKGNLEEITQAMIGGIYTADPKTLSLKATLPRFIEFEKKYGSVLRGLQKEVFTKDACGPRYNQFRSFKDGMQTLIDTLEQNIPPQWIQKNTLVQSIDYTNQKWFVRVNGNKEEFDYLIMAVPARAIVHLCNFLSTESKRLLKTIPFASCAILHFGFERSQFDKRINAMGMIVPHKEKRNILASTFCSQKFEGRAEHDRVLLRVFMGGAMNEDLCEECDRTLFHLAKTELKEILTIKGDPIYQNILKWHQAMPQYTIGHQQRVSDFFESTRNFENACFLGNTFSGVGIPDLIQKSKDAVEGILS